MAGSALVIEQFAKASGSRPSFFDRLLRPQRDLGLVPMGEKGRGRKTGQYEAGHLAYVLLGTAGHQPSDAAEAALHLGRMEHYCVLRSPPPPDASAYDLGPDRAVLELGRLEDVPEPRSTLHHDLTEIIDRFGRWRLERRTNPASAGKAPECPIAVVLTLSGATGARVIWDGRGDHYRPKEFSPQPGDLVRETSFGRGMIRAAADLWADTLAQRSGLDLPPPISGGDATSPEKSETPEPRHRVPASLDNNQPRKPKAGQSHSSENNSAFVFMQARLGTRGLPIEEPLPNEIR